MLDEILLAVIAVLLLPQFVQIIWRTRRAQVLVARVRGMFR